MGPQSGSHLCSPGKTKGYKRFTARYVHAQSRFVYLSFTVQAHDAINHGLKKNVQNLTVLAKNIKLQWLQNLNQMN
jgi:hypothetical protein